MACAASSRCRRRVAGAASQRAALRGRGCDRRTLVEVLRAWALARAPRGGGVSMEVFRRGGAGTGTGGERGTGHGRTNGEPAWPPGGMIVRPPSVTLSSTACEGELPRPSWASHRSSILVGCSKSQVSTGLLTASAQSRDGVVLGRRRHRRTVSVTTRRRSRRVASNPPKKRVSSALVMRPPGHSGPESHDSVSSGGGGLANSRGPERASCGWGSRWPIQNGPGEGRTIVTEAVYAPQPQAISTVDSAYS